MRFRPRLAEPKSLRDGSRDLSLTDFAGQVSARWVVYFAPLGSPGGAFESSQVIHCLAMGR